jgi:hypothetical protein
MLDRSMEKSGPAGHIFLPTLFLSELWVIRMKERRCIEAIDAM